MQDMVEVTRSAELTKRAWCNVPAFERAQAANGIKRVPNFRYKALKHMDAKFYRNLKYSKKWQKGGRPKDESDDEEEEEEE